MLQPEIIDLIGGFAKRRGLDCHEIYKFISHLDIEEPEVYSEKSKAILRQRFDDIDSGKTVIHDLIETP